MAAAWARSFKYSSYRCPVSRRKMERMHAGEFNLALVMRKLIGVGKPRQMQGTSAGILAHCGLVLRYLSSVLRHRLHFPLAWLKAAVTCSRPVTLCNQLSLCAPATSLC